VAALLLAGCNTEPEPPAQGVPEPINLLLPKEIRVHSFTGTRVFDQAGGVRGIEVRIEARDYFDDPTKAFGDFRFELYTHKAGRPGEKGQQLDIWAVELMDVEKNFLHWDDITRTYKFKLKWTYPIPVGRKFVVVAAFDSPYTDRLMDQRTFVAGQ
jgi:hypothetical protein